MFLEQLPQQLVNGIILGSIYALFALGYTVVCGIIKLIDFAHSDIYMLGTFVGYYAISSLYMNFWIVPTFTMIVTACLGMIIELLAYRSLRHPIRIAALITAIGVSPFLEYGMVFLVGANTRPLPQAIDTVSYKVGSATAINIQLLILTVSLVLTVVLQLIVKKTKMGKAMRAVSVNSDAAELTRINVNSTISFTFTLGSVPAGAAGVLIGPYYNSIEPLMEITPDIKVFVAAALGDIDIIPGVALGGFVIGILEILSISFNLSSYRDATTYGVLIIILLARPAGILGKNVKEKM